MWRRGSSPPGVQQKRCPPPLEADTQAPGPRVEGSVYQAAQSDGGALGFLASYFFNLSFGISGSSYLNQSPPSENIAALILETKDPTEHPNLHTVPRSPHCGPEPVYRGVDRCHFLLHLRKSKLSQEKPRKASKCRLPSFSAGVVFTGWGEACVASRVCPWVCLQFISRLASTSPVTAAGLPGFVTRQGAWQPLNPNRRCTVLATPQNPSAPHCRPPPPSRE